MKRTVPKRLGGKSNFQILQLTTLQCCPSYLQSVGFGRSLSEGEIDDLIFVESGVQQHVEQARLARDVYLWHTAHRRWIELAVTDVTQATVTFGQILGRIVL